MEYTLYNCILDHVVLCYWQSYVSDRWFLSCTFTKNDHDDAIFLITKDNGYTESPFVFVYLYHQGYAAYKGENHTITKVTNT